MAVVGPRWTRYLPGRRGARTVTPAPVVPARFDVSTEQVGDATVVAVAGEVDIAAAPGLGAALAAPAADRPLVIDLGGVTFMDSTGLALLLKTVRARAPRVAIAAPEGPARLLFAVSGTEDELPLHWSRDEALRAAG